jgi:hypothetical protein
VEEEGGEKRLPAAVIIGTRKGGTRALLEFLALHPLVRRAPGEPHYYDRHWGAGTDSYLAALPGLRPGMIAVEKTPGYFHTVGVPARLKATAPHTKLLVIARDPVRRLLSDYNQFLAKRRARNLTFPRLELLALAEDGAVAEAWPPLRRSIYHVHMARWLRHFPLSQFLVLDGDRFIQEPWVELARVQSFLELPAGHLGPHAFYYNATKGFYCGTRGEGSCRVSKCLNRSKGRPAPPAPPALLATLCAFFQPHNARFFKQLKIAKFDWGCDQSLQHNITLLRPGEALGGAGVATIRNGED